jgi:polar amino acid transport system substrate-binding protein
MMKMKRVLMLAVLGFFASAGFAQTGNVCEALVITGHPAYPPVAWGADGKIIGSSAELVTAIAKQLQVKKISSVDFGSWQKAQDAIKDGKADIIFGIYKDTARVAYMNYIDPPYMQDPVAIVIRNGDSLRFSEWSDLKGKKGVTNAGESYGSEFDTYIAQNLTVARANGVDKAFETLLSKQADYLIIGRYPGKLEAKKFNMLSKVDFLPKNVVYGEMYVAFSKKSKCYTSLQAGFSEGLKKAVSSGKIETLLEQANKQFYK